MTGGTLETTRAGHTAVSAKALQRLVAAIAADAFHVPHPEVRADVRDEQGQLRVQLALALTLVPLPELGRGSALTVFQRAGTARAVIRDRVQELAGTSVGSVDIRLTGALVHTKERVR